MRLAINSLVPLAGIEPALLAELDFESSASTNSATGAFRGSARRREAAKPAEYSGRGVWVNPRVSPDPKRRCRTSECFAEGAGAGVAGRGRQYPPSTPSLAAPQNTPV